MFPILQHACCSFVPTASHLPNSFAPLQTQAISKKQKKRQKKKQKKSKKAQAEAGPLRPQTRSQNAALVALPGPPGECNKCCMA